MSRHFIVGVDLGGTNLKCGLFNNRFSLLGRELLSTRQFRTKETLSGALVASVKGLIARCRVRKADILGVGVGLPGPVDMQRGLVHFFPNIPGWNDVPLRKTLTKALGCLVFLDNDANLMCLAEHRLGAAKGATNAVCLTLGTGVGGGLIIDNKLYRGSTYAAGELGHIPINESGPPCNCGGKACLEAYVGNSRIMELARKRFPRLSSLEELSCMASRGNVKAQAIWSEVGRRLGMALAGVVNVLNPDCVVIGGGIANAGEVLFDDLKKALMAQAMSVHSRYLQVCKAKLGCDAGLIGAAVLVEEMTRKKRGSR